VAEALDATFAAIHPGHATDQPVMILSIKRVEHRPPLQGPDIGAELDEEALKARLSVWPPALGEENWQVLRGIWAELGEPKFPMTLAQWQPYLEAFDSSADKPKSWGLRTWQRDPEFQSALRA
jgi:hypothetical protein